MKKYFLVTLMVALAVTALACLNYKANRIEEGNEIISRIERFKTENGKLPESLADLGLEVKEEGPIYYSKESDSRYIVWFGRELGESTTYDSDTREWTP